MYEISLYNITKNCPTAWNFLFSYGKKILEKLNMDRV